MTKTKPTSVIQVRAGMLVALGGRPCRVEHIDSLKQVTVVDVVSGVHVSTCPHHLQHLDDASNCAAVEATGASETELRVAMQRTALLKPFACGERRMSVDTMSTLIDATGLHRTQIYQCIRKLRLSPCPKALVRQSRGVKAGSTRLDLEVEEIVKREINRASKLPNAFHLKTICSRIGVACDDIGKRKPCEKTIRTRIERSRRELLWRKKLGRRRARERTRAMAGKISTTRALAIVEIDHSPLDIILVSSTAREPIGRAFLTVVVDTKSRALLGFHLGLDAPQTLSVALALVHAILPKEAWLAEHGLSDLDWPMYGLMEELRLDRGPEFTSESFRRSCERWGIKVRYRRKKEDGGIVERLIGTIQSRASQEPGATGSDTKKRRREKDPSEFAQMTVQEAQRWIAREVLQRYHIKRHKSLDMSPQQSWISDFTSQNGLELPPIVSDAKELLISFLPEDKRVISHDGISIFREKYYCNELARFVSPGIKRTVKYNPDSIGRIYVDPGTGEFIEVPFSDSSKPDMTLEEHREERKSKRRRFPDEFDESANRRYERSQQADRLAARRSTIQARKKEAQLQKSKRLSSGPLAVSPSDEELLRPQTEPVNYAVPPRIHPAGEI